MQQQSELPDGWTECQINDIISINYGKGLKKSNRIEGQFHVFGSNGIIGEHNQSLTSGPTIIIGRKGSVGEINLSSEPCWPIDTTYYIDNFYGVNRLFLYNLLKTLNLANYDTSTAIPGINRNDIYSIEFPLPPLAEQHRIVSAIEALFARLDAVNERLDRVPEILKKFRESVLAAACDGRLTEGWREENPDVKSANELPEGWCECKLKDKITINYGKGLKKSNRIEGQFNVFGSNGIIGKHNQYLTNGPTIIIGRKGSVGEINLSSESCWPIDTTYYIDDFRGTNHIFLYNLLKTLNLALYDTSTAIPGINRNDIYSQVISLPPLPEQHEIVRRVDALFALADSIEAKVAAARERTAKLRQSILGKAFSGELVETEAELAKREGRDYEPADVLLERIKASGGRVGKIKIRLKGHNSYKLEHVTDK